MGRIDARKSGRYASFVLYAFGSSFPRRREGGIYSSIGDLAKWDAGLYDSRLLSDESRRMAFAASTPADESDIAYGFGWRITGGTLWHSGETIGFRNVIVRYPKHRMTVVVLSNRNEPEPYRMALEIARSFVD